MHILRLGLALTVVSTMLASCTKINPEGPARSQLDSILVVPASELSVPVYFPLKELEDVANEKLASKIIESAVAISENNDTLYLSISRFERIRLAYDGDRGITYILPVQIDGHLKSRVLGIGIRNKKPIRARVLITLFSELYLNEEWNLAPKTEVRDFKWVEEPKVNVAGIKFGFKGAIEKVLISNKDKIISKLDESAGDMLKVRESIQKLWVDIQKPIRLNRKVVPVWLKADATGMNGRLITRSHDTLMVEVGLQANLKTLLDSAEPSHSPKPLPVFKRKEESDPALHVYANATIPFSKINQVIKQVTDTMKFVAGGHVVRVKSAEVYGTADNGIAIRLSLQGDVKADVYLRGTVGFDSLEKKLIIDNFGFDLASEQSLLNAANWLAHDVIIDRLKPYLSVSIAEILEIIPTLINRGVEKGKLGRKINIHFTAFDMNIYQHLVTRDNIQIIVKVNGRADVELQKGLFDKKKKPV